MQPVEAQIRVMRSALEDKWETPLAEHREIWPSLVEYSDFFLNRCEVGHDGKTAYERSNKVHCDGDLPGVRRAYSLE